MLYELVTGKPPFQGDDPTAVISQHLNTPPVAPSWHTEHCPPALEELDPAAAGEGARRPPARRRRGARRPRGVDPDARSASHSGATANPLERLARGVFVGRERELERLRAAFDEAFAGRGGVVMLVGEPGIGKTRTAQELETYARMRGAQVLWGRAHESAGAPPYWPWVQVGDALRAAVRPRGASRAQLRAARGAELQRIFPGLRDRCPDSPEPPTPSDPRRAQFRLFDAYAHLRSGACSAETPLLVVLDDLHWADKPTLLLLTHVARELARTRILVVGTYRDTDLDRTHPLSADAGRAEPRATAVHAHQPARARLATRSRDYIRAAAHVEPPRELVDRIFEETEGNPFFLTEVVNLMAQEGTLAATRVSDIAIPEGVREALGRRLDRLSEDANELLQFAAVAGREFAYDTLHARERRTTTTRCCGWSRRRSPRA